MLESEWWILAAVSDTLRAGKGADRRCFGAITIAVVASLLVWAMGVMAQSPNPFGIPSADNATPGSTIQAVPGSRARGGLAQGRSEVLARHGIVATSDPLAAQAGLDIMRVGGNAIDAAVAAGALPAVPSQKHDRVGGRV